MLPHNVLCTNTTIKEANQIIKLHDPYIYYGIQVQAIENPMNKIETRK